MPTAAPATMVTVNPTDAGYNDMSGEPKLFRINPENHQSESIEEVNFAQLGLRERRDIQEWVAANPDILGDDLLIIGKEFSGFDATNERLDLLAVDLDGRLVIIELKRDDSGTDAHWQAIKYASYFHRATADQIIGVMADYRGESQEEAGDALLQHLGADDLNALNNDQRIILASHRFAPEVTSAALWLNGKSPTEDLITCVKLTPYRDGQTDSLYVQATTIIPVPGADEYMVGVGEGPRLESAGSRSNFAKNLKETYERNKNDAVTDFLRKVGQLATEGLPDEIMPDKVSRWAGSSGFNRRYYLFWYSRPPWSRRRHSRTYHEVVLTRQQEADSWQAHVWFRARNDLATLVEGVEIHPEQRFAENGVTVDLGTIALNDEFAGKIAETLRAFIEHITPVIDDAENEANVEEI